MKAIGPILFYGGIATIMVGLLTKSKMKQSNINKNNALVITGGFVAVAVGAMIFRDSKK